MVKQLLMFFSVVFIVVLAVLSYAALQTAVLQWDPQPAGDTATKIKVFRGTMDCAAQGPLQPLLDATGQPVILGLTTTYTDSTVPDITGPVCYELSAANATDESARSTRVTKQVTGSQPPVIKPSVPTGLNVTVQ